MAGWLIQQQGSWKSFKYPPANRVKGKKNVRKRKDRIEILGRSIPQRE